MSLILGSEQVRYDRVIVAAKLNVDDFEITKENDAPGAIQHMGTGTVTVTYTPTRVARSYDASGGSTWSAKFERDLNLTIFKTR